jgi:hypothetical protein
LLSFEKDEEAGVRVWLVGLIESRNVSSGMLLLLLSSIVYLFCYCALLYDYDYDVYVCFLD